MVTVHPEYATLTSEDQLLAAKAEQAVAAYSAARKRAVARGESLERNDAIEDAWFDLLDAIGLSEQEQE